MHRDAPRQDDSHQPAFLAVDLQARLLPGTFEHGLNHLLDHEIDLSGFDARFNNDATGRPMWMMRSLACMPGKPGASSNCSAKPGASVSGWPSIPRTAGAHAVR